MEDSIIGLLLALFVTGVFLAAILRRRGLQRQVAGWPELAARTGLVYSPAMSPLSPPSVRGEYRGRYLSMDLIMIGDPDHVVIPNQNTSISLDVEKRSTFSLCMQAKRGFTRTVA
jgi:hypothetical protein